MTAIQCLEDQCLTASDVLLAAKRTRDFRRKLQMPMPVSDLKPAAPAQWLTSQASKPASAVFLPPLSCRISGTFQYGPLAQTLNGMGGRIRLEDVLKEMCLASGISRHDMVSRRKTANLARPRQVSYVLCKILTTATLPEIGRKFCRDHTTILYGIRKLDWLAAELLPHKDGGMPLSGLATLAIKLVADR